MRWRFCTTGLLRTSRFSRLPSFSLSNRVSVVNRAYKSATMETSRAELSTPDSIVKFWFGCDPSEESAFTTIGQINDLNLFAKWFGPAPEAFDAVQKEVASAGLIDRVASGADGWDESPRSMLARVILLDQFPRCVYRGTAQAFQYDEKAAELVTAMLRDPRRGIKWVVNTYKPAERFFLAVALQHSEKESVRRISLQFAPHVKTGDTTGAFDPTGFSKQHSDVIERFGRYPGRNTALGRETTAEEQAWLASEECPAWSRSQSSPAAKG